MMRKILKLWAILIDGFKRAWNKFVTIHFNRARLGFCGKDVNLRISERPAALGRVFLYDDTSIDGEFQFISYSSRFVMKEHSNAVSKFTVVTGNHGRVVGEFIRDTERARSHESEKDVIVEQDVEIGSNVTLLAGVHVGRGASLGSGAVVRTDVPPYSIVIGNPAKVVGFSFTPEQIIEHEKILYSEEERLPLDLLEKNYEKFFLKRMKEIRTFTSL